MSGRPNLYHAENEGWRHHSTSRCPVHPETMIRVIYANGHVSKEPHPASWWANWRKNGLPFDIAQYREEGE